MANPASGSGNHPREETAAAAVAPATTTTVDDKPVAENAVPGSEESTQKPQVVNPQVGVEDDEDSDFDELDGKHYHINPAIAYHTTPCSLLLREVTNTNSLQLQTS
jgi:hypothetical protein